MVKNFAFSGSFSDLFVFLTKVNLFLQNNPDYTSIRLWCPHRNTQDFEDFVSFFGLPVSFASSVSLCGFLDEQIPMSQIDRAREHYFKDSAPYKDLEKFSKFLSTFFSTTESLVDCVSLDKYPSEFPFYVEPNNDTEEKYIVVHPFSSVRANIEGYTPYPESRWVVLLGMIRRIFPYSFYLVGNKEDKDFGLRSLSKEKGRYVGKFCEDFRGELSLKETLSLIYGSVAVLGVNSWPCLASVWADKPTYCFWHSEKNKIRPRLPKSPAVVSKSFIENGSLDDTMVSKIYPDVSRVLDHAKPSF